VSNDSGGGGGFRVVPDTLTGASDRLFELATAVAEIRDDFANAGGAAEESLAAVSAGGGWASFRSAWAAAVGRLSHSIETFALNTEAAAVRYEEADRQAMPPVGPVLPSPEDLEEAWDEACEPHPIFGIPDECEVLS
jgi:hypothetical protein